MIDAGLRKLAAAVLLRAAQDARRHADPHTRAQAQRWLLDSPDMPTWAAMADLDADRIRDAVRRGTIHRCAKRSRGERIAWCQSIGENRMGA